MLLVNTRVSRSTKEYVAGVRRKLETFPAPMGQILDAMDSISKDVGSVKSIYLFYLLENTDGAAACYLLFLLTAALLMTSSQSKATAG